ncbi:hypothetical protein NDU88_005073 [Pleurodeles waltl]|uniref:Uncharacterized protein n=1 Tax=Pleurodeles waltl TaxID=8319 RepID=A0AAV7V306_PLEWA|nr:hypothetical protein NDU88_005073 [Pleurodeles waltl]
MLRASRTRDRAASAGVRKGERTLLRGSSVHASVHTDGRCHTDTDCCGLLRAGSWACRPCWPVLARAGPCWRSTPVASGERPVFSGTAAAAAPLCSA